MTAMSTIHATTIHVKGPLYQCCRCKHLFTDRSMLEDECVQFEAPDQHICTYCYNLDACTVYAWKDETRTIMIEHLRFEVRTSENGKQYRYYYATPKPVESESL